MRRLDITGHKFGGLVAKSFSVMRGKQSMWICVCECGSDCVVQLGNLRSGHTVSCGCQRAIVTKREKTQHGMSRTPTYRSWVAMLTRCTNFDNHKFVDYGGRGIKVCDKWKRFDGFFEDMGIRPVNTTLGRIENDGNYEKSNCEWQGSVQQASNKRNTRLFDVDGVSATLAAHCERLGLKYATIKSRIYLYHWPLEQAFKPGITTHNLKA